MRSILTGFFVLLAVSNSAAAQDRVIQSPSGRGLALVETSAGHRIEDPAGTATAIDVPPGAVLSSFEELTEGWIAGGNRWTDNGNELVLLRQSGPRIERIEPPAGGADALRTGPVVLIEDGRLSGLAWLEGDGGEKNAVMASRWTGEYWEAVETVSPMTGEARLALSGTVLNDGSTLLTWAAVDAGDDEVFWSHHRAGGWSVPARVHPDNDVPDVAPRVAAVGAGAVVAWSQYDGKDYRLRLARFVAGSWTDTGFVGEKGSFLPTLFPTASGAGFLYLTGSPAAWSVIEVQADGRPRRRAAMPRDTGTTRPLVLIDEPETVRLRFVAEGAVEEAPSDQVLWHRLDWTRLP